MCPKNATLSLLCIAVTVLLAGLRPAQAGTSEFYRLNDTGGTPQWEETVDGYYKVYDVGIHSALGDLTYYAAGTNCLVPAHKPGSADWPEHLHVHRDNDSSPEWVSAYSTYVSGKKHETKKYYEVRMLNNGGDPKVRTTGTHRQLDDDQDEDSQHGEPNFRTVCYGYAFHRSGVEDYNDIIVFDGSTGAGRVIDGLYSDAYDDVEDTDDDWIMHISGRHANYISYTSTNHCDIRELMFKYSTSQIFEFEYDAPGMDPDDGFWDWSETPEYHKKN